MCGAAAMKITPIVPRKIAPIAPAVHAARSARSGFLAPRFCPTSVAAALASPKEGRMAKMTSRMAMV